MYKVIGRNEFPLDMLRYDECWPVGVDDARAINSHERGWRIVALESSQAPTVGRWDSFCWTVVPDGADAVLWRAGLSSGLTAATLAASEAS